MFGSRPSPRLLGGLGALLVVSIWTSQVVAQPSPVRVVLSSEGTLYLVQSGNAWTIVPNSISATELAALTPSGELDGAIPAPFLGAPGTPSVLEAVQADDGTLYIVQGGNVWTLVAALIADADLAALTVIGEVDGEISSPSLNAPVAPAGQAPPDPVSQGTAPLPVPTPTTAVAQGEATLQPAPQCVNSVQGLSGGALTAPQGVAADPQGGVYIAVTGFDQVLHYPTDCATPDRVYGWNGTFPRDLSVSRTSIHNPVGLAPEHGGGLYVADLGNNRVLHFSGISTTADRVYGQNGSFTNEESYSGDTGMVNPFGVAVDSVGGLYVADTNQNRVLHFGAGSTTPDRVYGQTDSATNQIDNSHPRSPTGVAIDKAGGLFVVDTGHDRVLHFSSGSRTADRVYGQNGSFTTSTFGPSLDRLYEPYGVGIDSTGGLYVADSKNNRVLHFSGTSTTPDRVYGQGSGSINGVPFAFLYPTGVSADSAGGLYIADSETNRVLHFSGDSTSPDRVYGGS